VFLVVGKKEFFLVTLHVQPLALVIIVSIPHLPLPLVGKKLLSCTMHIFILEFSNLTLKHGDTFHSSHRPSVSSMVMFKICI
jgi:hypothetical protein